MNPANGYIRDGLRQCLSTSAVLTTNPLRTKGDPWLSLSVPKRKLTGAFWRSLKPEAKQLNVSNWTLPPNTSSLTSGLRTRPLSPSTLSRMSWSTLNSQAGKPENTNRSNAGDLFTADRRAENLSNIKPEPAEGGFFVAGNSEILQIFAVLALFSTDFHRFV